MIKKYDTLVFNCRAQPVHNAHIEIIRRALSLAKELIIIIGSVDQPRTYKNPWSFEERKMMINNVLNQMDANDEYQCRVVIEPNIDTLYSDQAWVARVQTIVSKNSLLKGKTGIIGHIKDFSSEYLKAFPQWELEQVELIEPLNATDVRDLYFRRDCNMNFLRSVIPQPTFRLLEGWKDTPEYNLVIEEREFAEMYKRQWAGTPYPVNFMCVDALVIKSGHVLLITRRSTPGLGTKALPGGYVNTNERLEDAMIRELREETKLKVPDPVLRGSIVKHEIFDYPTRSSRGRVISVAYLIDLGNGPLDKVKGSDDAIAAAWVPLAELKSSNMFEDHREIIRCMTGI